MSQKVTYTAKWKASQIKQEKRTLNKVTPQTFKWNISTT